MLSTTYLRVALYLCLVLEAMHEALGSWRALCQLKKPFEGLRLRQGGSFRKRMEMDKNIDSLTRG